MHSSEKDYRPSEILGFGRSIAALQHELRNLKKEKNIVDAAGDLDAGLTEVRETH